MPFPVGHLDMMHDFSISFHSHVMPLKTLRKVISPDLKLLIENKTPANHRDIFRYKKYNAPARVRTHDLVPGRQTHYQLCHRFTKWSK